MVYELFLFLLKGFVMDTINEKWNEVLLKIKLEMMPTSYDTWIKPLVLKSVSIEKGIIQLITYSEMSKSILTNRYLNIIETAVAEIYGKKLNFQGENLTFKNCMRGLI